MQNSGKKEREARLFWIVFFICILFFTTEACATEPITRLSARQELQSLKEFHSIPAFKIGGKYKPGNETSYELGGRGGVTLESLGQQPLRVAYIAIGTPAFNSHGQIINAIVINSYHSGDSTNMYYFWHEGQEGTVFSEGAVIGPGKLIDTDKYYVVFVDLLGLWGASKPSDGLGMKFPYYTYFDIVQANYRLLKDKLGIAKVKLVTGVSMGGSLCYSWAILHPDFVEAIMPIGGNTAPDPIARWTFQLMTDGIQSDPVWQKTKGDYYHLPLEEHPKKGVQFGWSLLNYTSFALDYVVTQDWEDVKGGVFYWTPEDDEGVELEKGARDFDANDMICRNKTCDLYDIDAYLPLIKAKTLVIHIKNDQWLIYKDVERRIKKIKGARIIGFKSPLAHYAIFRSPHVLKEDVLKFFKSAGIQTGAQNNESEE